MGADELLQLAYNTDYKYIDAPQYVNNMRFLQKKIIIVMYIYPMYKQVISAKGPLGDLVKLCSYTWEYKVINKDTSR